MFLSNFSEIRAYVEQNLGDRKEALQFHFTRGCPAMRDPDRLIAGEGSFTDGIVLPQIGLCSESGVIAEKVHPGAVDPTVRNRGRRTGGEASKW